MGLAMAILAAIFAGIEKSLFGAYLRKYSTFSFYYKWSFATAFLVLPLAIIFELRSASNFEQLYSHYWLVLLSGCFWGFGSLCNILSYRLLDLGFKVVLARFKIVFLIAFSMTILGEEVGRLRLLGTALIVLGVILVSWKHLSFSKTKKTKTVGFLFSILSSLFFAIAMTVDKNCLL